MKKVKSLLKLKRKSLLIVIGCLSFSISAMENSTDQLLMPLTDKILNVIGENANN